MSAMHCSQMLSGGDGLRPPIASSEALPGRKPVAPLADLLQELDADRSDRWIYVDTSAALAELLAEDRSLTHRSSSRTLRDADRRGDDSRPRLQSVRGDSSEASAPEQRRIYFGPRPGMCASSFSFSEQ